jgi:hypothetical protein
MSKLKACVPKRDEGEVSKQGKKEVNFTGLVQEKRQFCGRHA